ncbi:MAG: hypothetical protein Q8K75_05845 [Chlamydiales bacterium]|nr:hypothetical protein [Chlamydiales bacterium]
MDFTREPIIETIITPREGFKLVVRSSKGVGQEEYFVEAVEIVSFGNALFFRSLERPKCFLVPVTEYEILEVREARMVLKNVGVDSTIKIAGGREARPPRPMPREREREREPAPAEKAEGEDTATSPSRTNGAEVRPEKKRERRRQSRRRRGGRDDRAEGTARGEAQGSEGDEDALSADHVDLPPPRPMDEARERRETANLLNAILPPPTQLISETLDRYRDDDLFKGVFHAPKAEEASTDDIKKELKAPEETEVVAVAEEKDKEEEKSPRRSVELSEEYFEATFSEDEPPLA